MKPSAILRYRTGARERLHQQIPCRRVRQRAKQKSQLSKKAFFVCGR